MITASNREEFQVFSSWHTLTGAAGDGITDDTAALQAGLNGLGVDYYVLYIPLGNYRITATLTKNGRLGCAVFGEDPAKTRIFWDGALNGRMLICNGFSYYHMGRIHWDGRNIASDGVAHEWDGSTGYFVTFNEHMDCWYSNFRYHGLQGGTNNFGDAETTVKRCRFLSCGTGVSVHSFNALDWWIWDCYFERNNIGVSNSEGGGNFQIHQSVFKQSVIADIQTYPTQFFGARGNWSYGSRRFFEASDVGNNSSVTTLQNNAILDPLDQTPINILNQGPLICIDNVIRSRPEHNTGTVIKCNGDVFTAGNTFTSTSNQVTASRKISYDNAPVSIGSIIIPEPLLSPIPRNVSRPVLEVSTSSVDASIASALAAAILLNGQKPVIHFAAGAYTVTQSVVIPSGTDIQIVGDGMSSRLNWDGVADGKMLHFLNGRNNTVKSLLLAGVNGKGTMLYVRQQQSKMFYARGISVETASEEGMLCDTISGSTIEMHDFNHASNNVGVRHKGVGSLNLMTGASSDNNLCYDLTDGGKLLVQDIWYETSSLPGFLNLTGAGTFTVSGTKVYTVGGNDSVTINNFNGKVAILGMELEKNIKVTGDGTNTKVLALGVDFITYSATNLWMQNDSPHAQVQTLHPKAFNNGSYNITQIDTPDQTFIIDMLSHLRNASHQYRTARVGFFMHRVRMISCKKGLRIRNVP